VIDGSTGWLVRERDVPALEERLARLIDQPDIAARMGEAGRAMVEEHYNIDTLNDRLSDMLSHLPPVMP
jgi:glycosyltransferase involved in cell wall biosynthesis